MKTVSSIIPMSLVNLLVDDPQPKPKGRVREQNPDLCMMEINGIGCLPRDLIIEILSRLPVKVLCNFKCVSKQWLNTISNDTCLLKAKIPVPMCNSLVCFFTRQQSLFLSLSIIYKYVHI
uniref:F-box domain-containing protein n=1 Tax=Davidia involucrata TaxID=16924 RepID=A0A5B7BB83_DAVIN